MNGKITGRTAFVIGAGWAADERQSREWGVTNIFMHCWRWRMAVADLLVGAVVCLLLPKVEVMINGAGFD